MSDEQQPLSSVPLPSKSNRNVRNPSKPGFHKGHLRAANSGRKKHSSQYVRQLSEELGICPIDFLLRIVRDGYVVKTVLKDGKRTKVEVDAPLEMQVDCAKTLAQYIVPKLQSTALTNADHDGPVESVNVSLDFTKLSAAEIEAIQTVALVMARSDDDQPPVIDAPAVAVDAGDVAERAQQSLETDTRGHLIFIASCLRTCGRCNPPGHRHLDRAYRTGKSLPA